MDFYRPPTSQGVIDALGTIYRALRAWKFYPKGHPNRRRSIDRSHSAMLALLDGHNFSLSCGRTRFSFPDGEVLKDNTSLTPSLSHELFVRRVQKITFLQDLYLEDLLALLRILSLSPDNIQKSGGVDKIMAEHGIRSIWVNEFDLSVIRGKRREVESKGVTPPGVDEAEEGGEAAFEFEQQQIKSDDIPPEQMLPILLVRLTATQDDDIYMMLVRQAISCCDSLKARGSCWRCSRCLNCWPVMPKISPALKTYVNLPDSPLSRFLSAMTLSGLSLDGWKRVTASQKMLCRPL